MSDYKKKQVVILGSDGSGKSTIITKLKAHFLQGDKGIEIIHLKPSYKIHGVQPTAIVYDPHKLSPRSSIVSVFKILSWLFLYWIDYLIWIRAGKELRIWDRYYHDILVDPRRYRYGGPLWFVKAVGKLIPQPDLWILLDATPDVVQERKKEVPFHETKRQRTAYIHLVRGFENSVIIDASRPLDRVVGDSKKAVLSMMVQKTGKRVKHI